MAVASVDATDLNTEEVEVTQAYSSCWDLDFGG